MEIPIFLGVYTILLVGIVLYGGLKHRPKARGFVTIPETLIALSEVTVIVPFRNESKQLPLLLNCLQRSHTLPARWIFVNDHSDDNSVAVFGDKSWGISVELLHLPQGKQGKKEALRVGMAQVTTKWVLTMDADVVFDHSFFTHIQKLPEADLWILPVILVAENPLNQWQEVDLHITNAVNVGLYGVHRPVICSGANLLFKSEVFRQVEDWEAHQSISSGDDMFTLRAFRQAKRDIRLLSDSQVAVYTPATRGFLNFMSQRLRWVGKTLHVKDHLATFLGFVQTLFSLTFFGCLVNLVLEQKFEQILIFLGFKSLVEMIVFAPYFFRFKRFGPWLFLPLMQLLNPLYHFLLLVLAPFVRPRWKGRLVNA